MSIVSYLKQIDWNEECNKRVAKAVYYDAYEYWKRVEDHIYKGNEIRADKWMDYSEKQEELKRLDRKRTEAHDKMLISAADLIDILSKYSEFDKADYRLGNRTQIADFIAMIAFNLLGITPSSTLEGNVRDELAELLHNGTINTVMIRNALEKYSDSFSEG